MKKYFLAFLLITSLSFIFVSCDNVTEINEPQYIFGINYMTGINPYNTTNQYDSIGICHNLLLNYIIDENIGFTRDSATYISELKLLVNDFIVNNNYLDCDTVTSSEIDVVFHNLYSNIYSSTCNDVIVDYSVSSNIKVYFDSLMIIITDMISDSSSFNSGTDVMIIVDKIKLLENSTINDTTLSVESKQQFLSSTSIARHSLCYWTSHIFEANSDWDNITFIDLPQAQLFLKDSFGKDNKIQDMVHIKDWHWAAQVGVVAGMDAFAYFSGYYLQGNGSGPRKTVPGWIGAAVSSGGVAMACWGEDIANLISEAWDWLVN